MIHVNYPYIKPEWVESLKNYLLNVSMANFQERNILEKKIAKYVKAKYCVALNSGTSAMILALMAAEIGQNDEAEVIGPNYSNIAWINSCRFLKVKPVLVDIKPNTLCMNPDLIKLAISKKTKAIIFVNHSSYVGEDLIKIRSISDKYKLLFLEDSRSSFASSIDNKHAGTFGHMGTYSFSTPKTLSSAEGGAVVTNNKNYYDKLLSLQYHGQWYSSHHKKFNVGANFNLSPILAHFLNSQLDDIDFILENKKRIYYWYKKYELPFIDFKTDNDIGPNIYCYKAKNPTKLQKFLFKNNIETYYKQYVAINRHLNIKGDFPISDQMEKHILTLPGHPHLKEADIKYICDKIKLFEGS